MIGMVSGSGKLCGLRRPEAVAALPRARPPGSGLLVIPFAGVPPGEPIGEPSNARAGAGTGLWSAPYPLAWTWLVRPKKASAVTTNGAGLDASKGSRHGYRSLLGWSRVVKFQVVLRTQGVDLTRVRSVVRPLGCLPYLCQVGRTTVGAPHTCIRPASRVESITSTGQLSEDART
ncbi:hypothetical protein BHE74_00029227 [Ensete ventricosum]|nr:hypothetical protein BHE74_00029227 [Ensete ventricosum]